MKKKTFGLIGLLFLLACLCGLGWLAFLYYQVTHSEVKEEEVPDTAMSHVWQPEKETVH